MSKSKLTGLLAVAAVLVVASLALVQGPGILFPDWSEPTKGNYQQPAEEIGKQVKAAQPWSVTTVTSSIEGQTVKGQPIEAVGEVIDISCYGQVGKHGDKHRDCAQKCARSGEPIGLLTKDGTVYTLMAEEHNPRRDGQTTLREKLIDQMAYVIKVNGTYSEAGGQRYIYVQGFVKQ
jgi:hypothetical protein